jgi:hypothetical protein
MSEGNEWDHAIGRSIQYFSDRLNSAKKVPFNRTLADPHNPGDFHSSQIIHKPETKNGQLLHRNKSSGPPDRLKSLIDEQDSLRRALDASTILDCAGRIAFRNYTPAPLPRMISHDIHGNVRQPCLDARILPEVLPASPRIRETLLCQITGDVSIALKLCDQRKDASPLSTNDLVKIQLRNAIALCFYIQITCRIISHQLIPSNAKLVDRWPLRRWRSLRR